jgi:hypothetical protein
MKKLTKIFKGAFKNFDEETKTATVVMSTGSIDRDSEIIKPAAFKNRIATYKAHPILLACHNPYELQNQIGEAKDIKITDAGLEVTFEWYAGKIGADGKSLNPKADWAWFLVTRNIAAFSVGMMIHDYVDGKRNADGSFVDGVRRIYTDVELLENSQVLIPSNRDAVQARRSAADGEEKELLELAVKSIKDEEFQDAAEVCPKCKLNIAVKTDGTKSCGCKHDAPAPAEDKPMTKEEIKQLVSDEVKKHVAEEISKLKQTPPGEGALPLSSPTSEDVKGWVKEAVNQIQKGEKQ